MNIELAQSLVTQFFPGAISTPPVPLGEGLINQTWQLETSNGRWLLQKINTALFRNPEALMDNMAAIARHLVNDAEYPLRVAAPVSTSDGRLFYTDPDGDCWRIFPFFDNTFAPERLPTPEQAYEAAKAYAHFIKALRDFPAETLYEPLPGFHDTVARYAQFRTVLENDPVGRLASVGEEVEAVLAAEKYALEVHYLIHSGQLPVRVTHNDTKAGNVLLDTTTHRAVSVIDWDTVMPGTVLSDYGDMVRTFVSDRYEDDPADGLQIRPEVLDALDKGFLEVAGSFLTHTEIASLPLGARWIVTEQALRFLTDYIAGDVYYKVKDGEHNLRRARNQLALLKSLENELHF